VCAWKRKEKSIATKTDWTFPQNRYNFK